MNELTLKLFTKAMNRKTVPSDSDFGQWVLSANDIEKFARLIAEECVDCALWVGETNTLPIEPINTAHAIKLRIHNRFGIEQ
jgi:hypothetical protein